MPEDKPQGEVIMMGKREKVPGWKGELFVEMVKLQDAKGVKYQVLCDSTNPVDLQNLPATKIFEDKMEALNYAMEMERSKAKWKTVRKE